MFKANSLIRIFSGATAIVTGGASGLGRGLAEELAERGREIIMIDLQIDVAHQLAAQISTAS